MRHPPEERRHFPPWPFCRRVTLPGLHQSLDPFIDIPIHRRGPKVGNYLHRWWRGRRCPNRIPLPSAQLCQSVVMRPPAQGEITAGSGIVRDTADRRCGPGQAGCRSQSPRIESLCRSLGAHRGEEFKEQLHSGGFSVQLPAVPIRAQCDPIRAAASLPTACERVPIPVALASLVPVLANSPGQAPAVVVGRLDLQSEFHQCERVVIQRLP